MTIEIQENEQNPFDEYRNSNSILWSKMEPNLKTFFADDSIPDKFRDALIEYVGIRERGIGGDNIDFVINKFGDRYDNFFDDESFAKAIRFITSKMSSLKENH